MIFDERVCVLDLNKDLSDDVDWRWKLFLLCFFARQKAGPVEARFFSVRPAAHVSSRCKSGVRPVVGRT